MLIQTWAYLKQVLTVKAFEVKVWAARAISTARECLACSWEDRKNNISLYLTASWCKWRCHTIVTHRTKEKQHGREETSSLDPETVWKGRRPGVRNKHTQLRSLPLTTKSPRKDLHLQWGWVSAIGRGSWTLQLKAIRKFSGKSQEGTKYWLPGWCP